MLHYIFRLMTYSGCLTWCAVVYNTSSICLNLGLHYNTVDNTIPCMPTFGWWLQLTKGELTGWKVSPLAFNFVWTVVGLFLFGFSHHDIKDIVSVSWFHRTDWRRWKYSLEALTTLQWERRMEKKWHSKRSLFSFDVLIKGVLRESSEQTVDLKRKAKTVAI